MINMQLFSKNFFPYKKEINFHMFGPGVQNWVVSQHNSTLVVTHQSRSQGFNLEFKKKCLNPQKICSGCCNASIFCLTAAPCYYCLLFGPPSDQIGTKENTSS